MRTLVVNCSHPHYNLGLAKLADYLRADGDDVTEVNGDPGMFALGYDRVCVGVIFSWHAPIARDVALRVKDHAEVWAGGPGLFALAKWWAEQTSLPLQVGLDERFDKQRGKYKMTFCSRGCPVGCSFCIVPKLEGTTFKVDRGFVPAPILCDNNLSALPVEDQEFILRRYRETGTPLMDANSGFEPKTFDGGTFERWRGDLKGPWRFAFDEMSEAAEVEAMARVLKPVGARKKRVYVLIGLEPFVACYERARKVIEWGCEPFVQVFRPLTWLEEKSDPAPRFDWPDARSLRDFQRYFNSPQIWRSASLQDYDPRPGKTRPFAAVAA